MKTTLSLLALGLGLFLLGCSSTDNRRVLKVSMYPDVPGAENLYDSLKQDFEAEYPDIRIEYLDNNSNTEYYSGGAVNSVVQDKADVVEVDCILIKDFVANGLIKPFPGDLDEKILPDVQAAATVDGKLYGAPHWLCSDFLLFDHHLHPELAGIHYLKDLEGRIASNPAMGSGLAGDFKGKLTLGELYLLALVDTHPLGEVLPTIEAEKIDPVAENNLRRYTKLFSPGFGRNKAYHNLDGFYGHQFARCSGIGLIGYSESLSDVFSELSGLTPSEPQVDPNQIDFVSLPMGDTMDTPIAWVDALAVSSKASAVQTSDAVAFIKYCTSKKAYLRVLVPSPSSGDSPRMLLPANQEMYEGDTLPHADLYRRFDQVIGQAEILSDPGLNDHLHKIAPQIDGDLDKK